MRPEHLRGLVGTMGDLAAVLGKPAEPLVVVPTTYDDGTRKLRVQPPVELEVAFRLGDMIESAARAPIGTSWTPFRLAMFPTRAWADCSVSVAALSVHQLALPIVTPGPPVESPFPRNPAGFGSLVFHCVAVPCQGGMSFPGLFNALYAYPPGWLMQPAWAVNQNSVSRTSAKVPGGGDVEVWLVYVEEAGILPRINPLLRVRFAVGVSGEN